MRQLRRRAFDVLVTAPDTDLEEDAAILDEVRAVRPGVRIVLLAPQHDARAGDRRPAQAGLRLLQRPLRRLGDRGHGGPRRSRPSDWKDGIEVLSATPDWIARAGQLPAPERGAPRQLPDRAALRRARGPPRRLHVRVPRGAHERDGARGRLRPRPGGRGHGRAHRAHDGLLPARPRPRLRPRRPAPRRHHPARRPPRRGRGPREKRACARAASASCSRGRSWTR